MKSKSSILQIVGFTTDNKPVCKGVFKCFETYGISLDILLDTLAQNSIIVSWVDFYNEAFSAGMSHDRIISKIEEAVLDKGLFNIIKFNMRQR